MIRLLAVPVAVLALFGVAVPAAAEPQPTETFAIGKCFNPAQPSPQRPVVFDYNCDGTGVLQDMAWTSWGADGAIGTGTDASVQCLPNCAQGPKLVNPVVVHAWNPKPVTNCPAGVQFYSDLSIAYPEGVPPWITPGTQWSPGTDFVTIDGMPAVHFSGLTPICDGQLR